MSICRTLGAINARSSRESEAFQMESERIHIPEILLTDAEMVVTVILEECRRETYRFDTTNFSDILARR